MRKYRLLAKKGEGTFSEVIKAQNIKTGTLVAIKCMKSSYKSADQVANLREIQAIKRLAPHPNIISLIEVLFDPPSGRLALVFELLEGNLYELMKDRHKHFGETAVKSFMKQIVTSLDHMHSKGVFHRDIKPENILVDKHGKHLKLADFGSCRGINSKPPFTEYISTRWYRPPECLLTSGMYGAEMDVWGAGCIMFELTTLYPLFPGTDEADQVHRIHRVLGTPKPNVIEKLRKYKSPQASFTFPKQDGIGLKKLMPDAAENYLDLLKQMVAYDTSERITSKRAMTHPYFVGDNPFPSSSQDGFKSTSTTSSISNGSTKGSKSRRAKIAPSHDIPSSSSFPSNPMAESDKASGPVPVTQATPSPHHITKPRSMVSILLARNNKNEFIQESKARNNTFHRNGGKNNNGSGLLHKKDTGRTNLPKLKSLIPAESKGSNTSSSTNNNPSFRKHTQRQPRKYAHIRSSGYGSSSVAPAPEDSATTKLPSLPSLNEKNNTTHHRTNRDYNSTKKTRSNARLPQLGRMRRGKG